MPGPGGVAAPAAPAWQLIASTSAAGNTSPLVSPAIDTTGANVLVWAISYYALAGSPTWSDSKGNTWVTGNTGTVTGVGTVVQNTAVVASPLVGTGHTFQITFTGIFPSFEVYAFKSATGTPFGDFNGGAGQNSSFATSGTTLSAGSVTSSHINGLVLSGLTENTSGNTYSINAGFVIPIQYPTSSGVFVGGALAWGILPSVGSINPTWTFASSTVGAGAANYIIGSM